MMDIHPNFGYLIPFALGIGVLLFPLLKRIARKDQEEQSKK
jgi:hypothetical protein